MNSFAGVSSSGLRRLAAAGFRSLIGFGVVCAAPAAAPAAAQAAETVRWQVAGMFPSHLPALGENAQSAAEMLAEMSGGAIQFRVLEQGALAPPAELSAAVGAGIVDAGYTWLGYDAARIPAASLFAARPFGMEPLEYVAWWHDGGGRRLAEEIYGKRKATPILCGMHGPDSAGWYRKEINAAEDLRGLKVRFAGLGGEVLRKAGATVTPPTGAETIDALATGGADGAAAAIPGTEDKTALYKVARYNYFPGWQQTYTAFHLIVNKARWEAFDERTRALVNAACSTATLLSLSRAEALRGPALRGLVDNGVEPRRLSDDVLRDLKTLTDQTAAAQAAADADFKKVYDSQNAFSKKHREWKSLASLPPDLKNAE